MFKDFVRGIARKIDKRFKTSICDNLSKILEFWYASNFLNSIRRNVTYWTLKCKYKFPIKNATSLKLHLGCGEQRFDEYINIDYRKTAATDLVCDIRKLPYPDNSADIIETYHNVEHIPRHDLPKVLQEWYRTLAPGGRLIIEFPNFDEIAKRYLAGDEKQLNGIFGLQRFEGDYHHFGYNFNRLRKALEDCGFSNIERKSPKDYHVKEWPCIRIECIKCDKAISFLSPKDVNKMQYLQVKE